MARKEIIENNRMLRSDMRSELRRFQQCREDWAEQIGKGALAELDDIIRRLGRFTSKGA